MTGLSHSECGGPLEIDRGTPSEIVYFDGYSDIYYPVRCAQCKTPLGLLPNVSQSVTQFSPEYTRRIRAS
jgi:hypothetical protein